MESSICTENGACNHDLRSSQILSDLPTVIRHDKQTYIEQRKGIAEVDQGPAFPKKWYEYDDIFSDPRCKIFMAESSIPNAGLGLFAGVDFGNKEYIDPYPQVVIPLIDISSNDESYSQSLLHNYPWNAWTQGAHFESESPSILYPNIGMMSNSHLGLTNIEQNYDKIISEKGSKDRSTDYGTGARSLYNAVTFEASLEEGIKQGAEIFSDYGENYFHDREEKFQMIFPTYSNYQEADKIVREFAETMEDEGDEISEETRKNWNDKIRALEEDGSPEKTRIAFALPEDVKDVHYVAKVGTARYSIPDSIRSIEWLEEHGMCLGNLNVGKSNIPYAGNGAFVDIRFAEGDTVAPLVLLPVLRKMFQMEGGRQQLLLNYSFGHPKSSLILFPYSSGAHFINHSVEPNAMIQWSSSDLHQNENLEKNPEDVSTGLIIEVIALRDIEVGEEVTIDYGIEWENAWFEHINSWENSEQTPKINPAVIAEGLNKNMMKPIRTLDEQTYPQCIQTACFSSIHNGKYAYTRHELPHLRFCHITDRVRKGDEYWYSARMEPSEYFDDGSKADDVVIDIPRDAIKFVAGKYCSDMHVENAFRHEINVPDGMYPDIWLDLKNDTDRTNGDIFDDE